MMASNSSHWLRSILVAALILAGIARVSGAGPGEIVLERAFMPDAAPSSFAVTFPNGVSFCYDPVRGGVNYAWQGGFDIAPARPGLGKFIKPVKLSGEIAYRETGPAPLRRAGAAHVPVIVFKGYRLQGDAVEFVYTTDGVLVHEEVRARPGGDGLVRRFRIEPAGGDARWWYVPGPMEGAVLTTPSGQFEGSGFRFDAVAAREFSLEIVFPRK
ncbi:MAG: hypothetical protein Q7S40_19995 [Opitutaceae bacterium]|nr:hypothetical protein [Opitutaceae bacterium]